MIDTLTLSTTDTKRLDTNGWPHTQTSTSGSRLIVKKTLNTNDFQATFTTSGALEGRLAIQTSLPKLIHGHNILDLSRMEILQAIERLGVRVMDTLGRGLLPSLDEWQVSKLDWCHSWSVGSPSLYIADIYKSLAAKRAEFIDLKQDARRAGMTLHIGTKKARFARLYDKGAEVSAALKRNEFDLARSGLSECEAIELSHGRLRFESVEKTHGLRKLIGPERSLKDLLTCRTAFSRQPLRSRWRGLVSEAWSPCEHSVAIRKIIETHGAKKAKRIADRYAHVSILGAEQYRRLFDVESENWRRWRAELREAGVFLGQNTSLERLVVPGSPLEIYSGGPSVRARKPWGFDDPAGVLDEPFFEFDENAD